VPPSPRDARVHFLPEDAFRADVAAAYPRNAGSTRVPGAFAAFEQPAGPVSVGIQLTAAGSELDVFWRFREVLRARPDLCRAYDALKRAHEGGPMDDYRAAKDAFLAQLRSEPEFAAARLPPGGG
jgi:GrpB-like predicted nucleotidyltransferase (UPF0157 family)